MKLGNFLTPKKDLSLDPFRLSHRMEHLFEDPLFRTMGGE